MSRPWRTSSPSARRHFAGHAAISLVPVVLIGLLLANSIGREAQTRGLAEAETQSALIAASVVEPTLVERDLREGLTPPEIARLRDVAQRAARTAPS